MVWKLEILKGITQVMTLILNILMTIFLRVFHHMSFLILMTNQIHNPHWVCPVLEQGQALLIRLTPLPQLRHPLLIICWTNRAEGPQEDPDPTCAAINEKLVSLIEKWFLGYCSPSEIRKLENRTERSENVLSLKPLKVNAELYYAIHSDGVEADRNLQYVSTGVAKSAQPLTTAWAQIFSADVAYLDANPDKKECVVEVTPELKLICHSFVNCCHWD